MHQLKAAILMAITAAIILAVSMVRSNADTGNEDPAPKNPTVTQRVIEMDKQSLERLHTDRVEKFVEQVAFGVRRVLMMPKIETKKLPVDSTGKTYVIDRMDLIGLLPGKEPIVRLATGINHALREEKKVVSTRALDEFEAQAVADLNKRGLVWKLSESDVRMVGALRASQDCLSCHKGKEGDILGAFSYRMVPGKEQTEEQVFEMITYPDAPKGRMKLFTRPTPE